MPGTSEAHHLHETLQIRDFDLRRDLYRQRQVSAWEPTRTVHPHGGQPEGFGWHMFVIETLRHIKHLLLRDTKPSKGEVEIW